MRRFLISAVAAAAVLGSAASPAQAHHDEVCAPAPLTEVCVRGSEHVVPAVRAEVWSRYYDAWWTAAAAAWGPYDDLEALPESVCAATLCVTGLRTTAQYGYLVANFAVFIPAYVMVCTAIGPPECRFGIPPVPPV